MPRRNINAIKGGNAHPTPTDRKKTRNAYSAPLTPFNGHAFKRRLAPAQRNGR